MRCRSGIWLGAFIAIAAAVPAFAQDQSVKDLLNRAQSASDQKAVEDLIKKLKPGETAPPAAAVQPGTAPAVTTPSAPAGTASAPVVLPPAGPGAATPPAQAKQAAPVAARVPAPTQPTAPAQAPVQGGAPSAPGVAPTAQPPTAVSAPAAPPPVAPVAKGAKSPLPASAAADPMAKAPEIAKAMNLPSVDLEVYFDYDSADITSQAMTILGTLGQALADPQLKGGKFVIAGHTDGKGRADYNQVLSQRRADAVRKFLIDQFKIEPANLVARGFGKSRLKNPAEPLADENRRVQIINWTSQAARGNFR